ncbi:MAG: hypothetical protein AB1468_00635 [Candidatus Micrarchaeota archaeon]
MAKNTLLLFSVFLLVLFAGCAAQRKPETPAGISPTQPVVTQNETAAPVPEGTKFGTIDRSGYGISMEIFKNLPLYREDFGSLKAAMDRGLIKNLCNLSEEHWKQPEFYPNFERNPIEKEKIGAGLNWFRNPPKGRWGVVGYGAFPSDAYVTIVAGDALSVCTFFHTSWGIETYQGLGFGASYPAASYASEEVNATLLNLQNSSEVAGYFEVAVTPGYTLMQPTFPVFSKDWTKKLEMKIKVKPGTPPGGYVVALDIGKPPADVEEAWIAEHLAYYVGSGTMFGVGRPMFRVFVTVPAK